jgi:hypothetical protein
MLMFSTKLRAAGDALRLTMQIEYTLGPHGT